MKQKTKFVAPRILQTVHLHLEEDLLAGTNQTLEATGQEVKKMSTSGDWDDSAGSWID